jgi:hypothetical protein
MHAPTVTLARVALVILLTFQLVVGSLLQSAHAAEAATEASASVHHMQTPDSRADASPAVAAATSAAAVTGDDCPMHHAEHGAQQLTRGAPHPTHHGSHGAHDCCHANACQCDFIQTPAIIDSLAMNRLAGSATLPRLSSDPFVAPRIDDVLRPPIA